MAINCDIGKSLVLDTVESTPSSIHMARTRIVIAMSPILADANRYASNRGTAHFNNNSSDFCVTPKIALNVESGRLAVKFERDGTDGQG